MVTTGVRRVGFSSFSGSTSHPSSTAGLRRPGTVAGPHRAEGEAIDAGANHRRQHAPPVGGRTTCRALEARSEDHERATAGPRRGGDADRRSTDGACEGEGEWEARNSDDVCNGGGPNRVRVRHDAHALDDSCGGPERVRMDTLHRPAHQPAAAPDIAPQVDNRTSCGASRGGERSVDGPLVARRRAGVPIRTVRS
jgi:hypothetical protein